MKDNKNNFLICIILVLSLAASFLLGLFGGKSLRTEVIANNEICFNYDYDVRRANSNIVYNDYVLYDPLETDVPNLNYSTSSYSEHMAYHYVSPIGDTEIWVSQMSSTPYWVGNVYHIPSYSLYLQIATYNGNEGQVVYYFDRLLLNELVFDFSNIDVRIFSFLDVDTPFSISRLVFNSLDSSNDSYVLSINVCPLVYEGFIDNNYIPYFSNEIVDVYDVSIYMEDIPLTINEFYLDLTNLPLQNHYIAWYFGETWYDDGYNAGISVSEENGWLGGIFEIFENASKTFVNVMNVRIFPGITLGTLVLFPLVLLLLSLLLKILFGG